MKDGPNIARIAALIGDHARAEILTALVAGQALTATELAQVAGVTKQTVSTHLAKLLDARLLEAESQGRHRYFRLADRDVAGLLESLMGVAYRAGELGVLVYDSLAQRRLLQVREGAPQVTRQGEQFFRELGIDMAKLTRERRPLC